MGGSLKCQLKVGAGRIVCSFCKRDVVSTHPAPRKGQKDHACVLYQIYIASVMAAIFCKESVVHGHHVYKAVWSLDTVCR